MVPVVEYDNHSFFDWHETWFGVIEWRVDRPIVYYCVVDDFDDVPTEENYYQLSSTGNIKEKQQFHLVLLSKK